MILFILSRIIVLLLIILSTPLRGETCIGVRQGLVETKEIIYTSCPVSCLPVMGTAPTSPLHLDSFLLVLFPNRVLNIEQ